MNNIFEWTPERVAQLRELWAQNLSSAEIARRIGNFAKDHTIRDKAARLGLAPRGQITKTDNRWTEAHIDSLKTLWQEGLSGREIAQRFGEKFTHFAIISKARHLDLPQRGEARARKGVRAGKRKTEELRAQASVETVAVVEKKPRAEFVSGDVVVAFERKPRSQDGYDIIELRECQCRFALDERGDDGQYLFCGARRRPDTKFMFCDEHLDVVLQNRPSGRQRPVFREAAE